MRVAAAPERARPRGVKRQLGHFTPAEDLPDILGTHRTYVGLRRGERWELLAITSASTTTLWEGPLDGPVDGRAREFSAMTGALLNDLTGQWAPPEVRDALTRRVASELAQSTFVLYSSDLDAWLVELGLDPGTWASASVVPRTRRPNRHKPSWGPDRRRVG